MSLLEYLWLFVSPLLGAFLAVVFVKKIKLKSLNWSLLFSGAFLLAIVVIEILPELFKANTPLLGLWLLIGFILQVGLELLTKGKEHGHFHTHEKKDSSLIAIIVGLSIHAFIEGMPLSYYATEFDHQHLIELPFLYAIIVHKLFVGLALGLFLIQIESKTTILVLIMILFALMSPLGVVIGERYVLSQDALNITLAIVAGSLLHIGTIILYEQDSTHNHKFSFKKMLILILGFLVAALLLL